MRKMAGISNDPKMPFVSQPCSAGKQGEGIGKKLAGRIIRDFYLTPRPNEYA
jgi:hypothetical protein